MATRIDTIRVHLTTGDHGLDEDVRIKFNGFDLTLNRISGGTAAGETFEGEFFVGSIAHSCALLGPDQGRWDLKTVEVEYDHGGDQQVRHHFGAFTLESGAEWDILHPPPAPSFDV